MEDARDKGAELINKGRHVCGCVKLMMLSVEDLREKEYLRLGFCVCMVFAEFLKALERFVCFVEM